MGIRPKDYGVFIVVTILLIALGALVDIARLDLEVAFDGDAIRYANGASVGPPVPAIVTVIMLIACGIGIARKTGWYWLLAASIFMFVASAAGATIGLITNLDELVFALDSWQRLDTFHHPYRSRRNRLTHDNRLPRSQMPYWQLFREPSGLVDKTQGTVAHYIAYVKRQKEHHENGTTIFWNVWPTVTVCCMFESISRFILLRMRVGGMKNGDGSAGFMSSDGSSLPGDKSPGYIRRP